MRVPPMIAPTRLPTLKATRTNPTVRADPVETYRPAMNATRNSTSPNSDKPAPAAREASRGLTPLRVGGASGVIMGSPLTALGGAPDVAEPSSHECPSSLLVGHQFRGPPGRPETRPVCAWPRGA